MRDGTRADAVSSYLSQNSDCDYGRELNEVDALSQLNVEDIETDADRIFIKR